MKVPVVHCPAATTSAHPEQMRGESHRDAAPFKRETQREPSGRGEQCGPHEPERHCEKQRTGSVLGAEHEDLRGEEHH